MSDQQLATGTLTLQNGRITFSGQATTGPVGLPVSFNGQYNPPFLMNINDPNAQVVSDAGAPLPSLSGSHSFNVAPYFDHVDVILDNRIILRSTNGPSVPPVPVSGTGQGCIGLCPGESGKANKFRNY